MKYWQQGDVLLFKVSDKDFKEDRKYKHVKYTPSNVLQYGEATGHSHKINSPGAQLFQGTWNSEVKYMVLKQQGTLTHEEHKPIVLPKGVYQIRIVREFDHFLKEERRVRD